VGGLFYFERSIPVKRVLITGGAGFVGHHFVEHILKTTDWEVVVMDRLDTSGNLNRLHDMAIWEKEKRRCTIVFHDLKAALNSQINAAIGSIDYILHLAAGSHVDRSIDCPMEFVYDNVVGTANLLDYARGLDSLEKMIYFSTDEVFGPAPVGVAYKEWDRYKSGNPYSASKAGAEELCIAYENTYNLPIMVTHSMNIFGERQHPEKFIPLCIKKIRDGEVVTIHANKTKTHAGTRFYIHARNVASATSFILENGDNGDKYNIVGEKEVDNLTLAELIANVVGKPLRYEMVDFHSSRPGHDLRYALDGEKLHNMGWSIPVNFESALTRMVAWTLENKRWLLG
jgi:dTDP-glucose 4,6-dehydratase